MSTKKNTTKNKPIKREATHFPIGYIPTAIETLGISRTFLDDAIGCYLDFRKEPEKLLTRNLSGDWNFHMFRDAVCKVFYVQYDHDLEGKRYHVCYDTLQNVGLRLPEWHPDTQVRIVEQSWTDSKTVQSSIYITNNNATYTYDPIMDRWTAEFTRPTLLLPEEPLGNIVELKERSVEMTSGLAWRLRNIHRLVKIQHPEYA